MSLAGLGVVCIWHDLLPEAKQEFYEWHSREHMPEQVGVPGLRRGRRYLAVAGAPEFFNLYEADSAEVLGGQDYAIRLNAPTAWTQRLAASFRNVERSVCRVVSTTGTGSGGVMLTMRFDVPEARRDDALEALTRKVLPPLAYHGGVCGVHLCLADKTVGRVEPGEPTAQDETTRMPAWVALIEGNAVGDVRDAGDVLAKELVSLGASAIATAVYRHEFTRLKTPWSAG